MTSTSFSATVERGPANGATITVAGEIDLNTVHRLAAARDEALTAGLGCLRIDLGSVGFIDSTGLKFLIETHRLTQRQRCELELLSPAEEAMQLFRLSGVDQRLPLLVADQAPAVAVATLGAEDRLRTQSALEIPVSAEAPRAARGAVIDLVARDPAAGRNLDTLKLMVSEVVTNAVLHAGAEAGESIGLNLMLTDERTRVEVSDPGGGFDLRPISADPFAQGGGFGLMIVDTAASRWGTATRDGRFFVWFEVDH